MFAFDLFDLVVLRERLNEVVGVFLADVFDSKVVHNKCELDGAGHVAPQAGRVGYFIIAVGCKPFPQQLVGQGARLGQAVLNEPGDRFYFILTVDQYGDYEKMNFMAAAIAGTGESVEELEEELLEEELLEEESLQESSSLP